MAFVCLVCGKTLASRYNLERHKERIHNSDESESGNDSEDENESINETDEESGNDTEDENSEESTNSDDTEERDIINSFTYADVRGIVRYFLKKARRERKN